MFKHKLSVAMAVPIVSMFSTVPAFAATVTSLGGNSAAITAAANQIIVILNGFGLPYIQGGVAVIIIVLTVVGAVKASREKAVSKLWTEIAFGLLAVILVLNPTLLITAALSIGSMFGTPSSTTTTG